MSDTSQRQIFQLSAVSQNDPGAADGASINCTITAVHNGTLRQGSSSKGTPVQLPTPPHSPTPTWFLLPSGAVDECSFTLDITGPANSGYPTTEIEITAKDVIRWADENTQHPVRQIYRAGVYGVIGTAQSGAQGPIYTLTAGVLDPEIDDTLPMTLTINQPTQGKYVGVFDPNWIEFHARKKPRLVVCTLNLGEGVPRSKFVSASYSIEGRMPDGIMSYSVSTDSQSITLTFNFNGQEETGRLSFVVDIDGAQHIFDPQVGNDPPPQ